MFDRARLLVSALLIVTFCLAGCGEESSSSETASEYDNTVPAAEGEDTSAEADASADDQPAPAEPVKAVVATPDVPIPSGVKDNEVLRSGWVTYMAAQKPAELAAFYQKELPAKGWTLGRNDTKPLSGTTLTGVVQEYRKGSEVLTVCLTEQIASEGAATMVVVMDIPLPPDTTQVVAFGNQAMVETPQTPDEAIAFLTKHLAPLGWSTPKASESAGTKSLAFRKGNRTLSTSVRAGSGQKGASITMMHVAYAG